MLVLLLVVLGVAGAGVGIYIAGNGGGTHDVTYLGQHWSGVDAWLPPLAIAGSFALLALVAIVYSGARIRLLRHANEALRRELSHLRGQAEATPQTIVVNTPEAAKPRSQPWKLAPATPAASEETIEQPRRPNRFPFRRDRGHNGETAGVMPVAETRRG